MTNEKYYAEEVYKLFARNYVMEKEFQDKKKICVKFEMYFDYAFELKQAHDIDFPPDIAFVVVYDIELQKFSILHNEIDVIKKYRFKASIKTGEKIDINQEIFFNTLESEFKERFEFWKKEEEEVQELRERIITLQPKDLNFEKGETDEK